MIREKRFTYNVVSNIVVQIVVAVSGFIIPKYILSIFGSTTNGMINSISQFLTYAGLVEMGIGNASIAALYKPIAQNDKNSISVIISSARRKYFISGCLYTFIIVCFAFLYPLCIKGQLNYWFSFSMVIVIAGSSVIDFFIIGKYKVLLIASQKSYVVNFTKAFATVISTIVSCFILILGNTVVIVKILVVFLHLCEAIFIKWYVQSKYIDIDYHVQEHIKLEQQRGALIHQLCNVIIYNTDLVVLTLFISKDSLKEVSVYSVYLLAFGAICNLMSCFTTGIEAIFGDMIVVERKIKDIFEIYKTIYLTIIYIAYSSFIVLIVPFVRCYTHGVMDVNYIRIEVGVLFGLNGLLANLKDAHGVVIRAYGHYKETQLYVIVEAVINIIISLLLVHSFGIVGVLVGTTISHFITSIGLPWYADKYLLNRRFQQTLKENFINILASIVLIAIEINIVFSISSWKLWLLNAMIIFFINSIFLCFVNVIANRKTCGLMMKYFRNKL